MRRSHLMVLVSLVLFSGCEPEVVPEPAETEVAPGWVLSRPFPDTLSLQDVVVLSASRAYAVGTGATLLRYDAGQWAKEPAPEGTPADAILEAVSGSVDEENAVEIVMAVGSGGLVLLRDGAGWRRLESGTDAHLFGVWVRRPDDAFIVGDDGTILRWLDGAVVAMDQAARQERTLPDGTIEEYRIPEALKSVAGRGGDDVFAVGLAGSVYHFDGGRWYREDSRTSRPFTDVFTGAGVLATATDGVVFRRGGDGWDDDLRTPVPLYLQGVWASGGNDVYAVGMAGSVFHWDGEAWTSAAIGDDAHLRAIDGVFLIPEGEDAEIERTVFSVGAGGRILRGPAARPGDDRDRAEPGE